MKGSLPRRVLAGGKVATGGDREAKCGNNWRKSPEFYKIIALFVCGVHDSYSTTVLLQENLNRNYSQSQPGLKHSHCWLAGSLL